MNCSDINIRDPFVLCENGKYYMYGTRAVDFGRKTGGFDVYVSSDLKEWSRAECFDSEKAGLNREVNWAPEVHKYNGRYYMFASFAKENGLRGTYALEADSPLGPFRKHSKGALTPEEWECIDGTFYSENGVQYLVFVMSILRLLTVRFAIFRLPTILRKAQGKQNSYLKRHLPNGQIKRLRVSII